jgi:EAL domain-containing protein (putative c-di-GMP-specific phosphodiesterase class I)
VQIDRSFVRDVADDPDAAALTEAIVRLASTLRLVTVAEGVERPEQLAALRTMGCALGQG